MIEQLYFCFARMTLLLSKMFSVFVSEDTNVFITNPSTKGSMKILLLELK